MTRREIAGLIVLSLWSSAAWVTDDLFRSSISPVSGEGVRLLLIGGLSLPFALSRRHGKPDSYERGAWSSYLTVSGLSLALIALPFLLLEVAEGRASSTLSVLIFSLLPVVLAVFTGGEGAIADVLPYCLAGVAGILVLLPISVPQSASAAIGLCLFVLAMSLTAVGMVGLHRRLRTLRPLRVLCAVCLVNGLLLLCGWAKCGTWSVAALGLECLRALLIDLPEVLLLVWLLRTVSPMRLSTRYLLAPLFTVLEGLAMLRPHLDGRTLVGTGLLAASVWMLLRRNEGNASASLSLVGDEARFGDLHR